MTLDLSEIRFLRSRVISYKYWDLSCFILLVCYWTALSHQLLWIAPVPIPLLSFLRNLCNQESLKGASFDSVFHGNLALESPLCLWLHSTIETPELQLAGSMKKRGEIQAEGRKECKPREDAWLLPGDCDIIKMLGRLSSRLFSAIKWVLCFRRGPIVLCQVELLGQEVLADEKMRQTKQTIHERTC